MNNQFQQLLNMFWLRPETALWRQIDMEAMKDFKFNGASLDLGCGDGVFSFIRAGGEFDKAFDAFQATTQLDCFFDKIDIFDAFDELFSPIITKKPDYAITVGFDHKINLLKKAKCLRLYNEVKQGDANERLPFDDNSFDSIFSNIVYWLDNPSEVLREIRRILKPDGKCCLMLPDICFPKFSFYSQLYLATKNPQWKFLENLDRGRFTDNLKHAKSQIEWEELFTQSGLSLIYHKNHLSKLTVQAWDIGLRPIFPALLEMVDAIDSSKLASIKQKWVGIFSMFLEPLLKIENNPHEKSAFHCYILKK